ncbi:MAG: gluconolaconase [Acidobacteriota bacterium]|jgi:sugar lactone lactonase YvrE|nr:gluconolaconase [Acidobacteriota bacterium]
MNKAGKILSINPEYSIPGGELIIECQDVDIKDSSSLAVYFNGEKGRIVGASAERFLVIVPDNFDSQTANVLIENEGVKSNSIDITIGKKIADNLHIVANPAVDPKDGSIILTRSGSRGQKLPATLFRLESDGYLGEMSADVMNPTGVAFDNIGKLLVTNRADGEVYQINRDEEVVPLASDLGIATGIAFDNEGAMYVGDRSGTIFKIFELGDKISWALLEPSVSAYHMAFGTDENLYVSAPGLCSYDAIYRIDKDGLDEIFYKGLGRPQGLAFDTDGNLYVAACLKGRHGIVKISPDGENAEIFVAGMGIVGLCFTKRGEMIVATNEAVYSLPLDIYGILLG